MPLTSIVTQLKCSKLSKVRLCRRLSLVIPPFSSKLCPVSLTYPLCLSANSTGSPEGFKTRPEGMLAGHRKYRQLYSDPSCISVWETLTSVTVSGD